MLLTLTKEATNAEDVDAENDDARDVPIHFPGPFAEGSRSRRAAGA
jgi:hypothetical protein